MCTKCLVFKFISFGVVIETNFKYLSERKRRGGSFPSQFLRVQDGKHWHIFLPKGDDLNHISILAIQYIYTHTFIFLLFNILILPIACSKLIVSVGSSFSILRLTGVHKDNPFLLIVNVQLKGGTNGYDFKSVKRWTTQRKLGYCLIECDEVKFLFSLYFLVPRLFH